MRWKTKPILKDNTVRFVKRFLWFPKRDRKNNEKRWLETAVLMQSLDADGGYVWDTYGIYDYIPDGFEYNRYYTWEEYTSILHGTDMEVSKIIADIDFFGECLEKAMRGNLNFSLTFESPDDHTDFLLDMVGGFKEVLVEELRNK